MASLPSPLDDFLVSFVRSTPEPRIHIISAAEDPRTVLQATSPSQGLPPPLNHDAFPSLSATAVIDHREGTQEAEHREKCLTYCEVLNRAQWCVLYELPMELQDMSTTASTIHVDELQPHHDSTLEMVSTSPFSGDLDANMSSRTHIRVIPAHEDPRISFRHTIASLDPPPERNETEYPSLVPGSHARSALLMPTYTYSEVLMLEGPRPPNILEWLPLEIRDKVWQARMDAIGRFCIQVRNYSRYQFLPAMCSISKSTKDETVAAYIRSTRFEIHSIADVNFLRGLLASVIGGERHVRSLDFDKLDFDKFDFFSVSDQDTGAVMPVNPNLELAVDCSGLQTVFMAFGRFYLGTHVDIDGGRMFRTHSVDTLVAKYRLDRILDCQSLHTVCFYGKNRGSNNLLVLQDLADWVEAEFFKVKRVVKCKVVWYF